MRQPRAVILLMALASVAATLPRTIPAPSSPSEQPGWIEGLKQLRRQAVMGSNYSTDVYETVASLFWTETSNVISPQVMIHDRYLYDPEVGYTPGRLLDDLERRYGGIDSLLLWCTYPVMGTDDRNQFQMHESVPGGLDGLRGVVDGFHARGVRVLLPLNPWDVGTAPVGKTQYEAMADLLSATGADGFNGDTMLTINSSFFQAASPPPALEPELGGDVATLAWTKMGWGYWPWTEPDGSFTEAPPVGTWHWLERRHRTHACDRWSLNHTTDLHFSFFNGVGFVSWENVWGIWLGFSPRDSALLRRTATLQRYLTEAFSGEGFVPHDPDVAGVVPGGVYGSLFVNDSAVHRAGARRGNATGGNGARVWLLVNRRNTSLPEGTPLVQVPCSEGPRYWDLYHGRAVLPVRRGSGCVITAPMEPLGVGAIMLVPQGQEPKAGLDALLAEMANLTAVSLASLPTEPVFLPQTLLAERLPSAAAAGRRNTDGMVAFAGSKAFNFTVRGVEIEGPSGYPVDCQYPWEDSPSRDHAAVISVPPFSIDTTPVTNERYEAFLAASSWRPADPARFLARWAVPNASAPLGRTFPAGRAREPVTFVSRGDAAAFCAHLGRRLPSDVEWQFAAQGGDASRAYPWGDEWLARCVPEPSTAPVMPAPDLVDAHPCGCTSEGVCDMVGNAWEWSSAFQDEHTRTSLLRGGSRYLPQGSMWYLPQAYKNHEHQRTLLLGDSYDRAGMLGFRCAVSGAA